MKICLIHASAGAGHQKAAEAIRDALSETTQHDIVLIDALDFASKLFKRMYSGTYSFMITKIPFMWGFFFGLVDIPVLQPLIRWIRRLYNGMNTVKLHKYFIEQQFDYIVTTHFMPNEIASALKRKGKIGSKIITCVTDYDVHRIWLAKEIDRYCVATDWTRDKLLSLGVRHNQISVTGIPSSTKFSQVHDVPALKKSLELDQENFTILVATGSFGIGPIEEIIDTLDDFQIMVVCGHNKTLYERLSQKQSPNTKVLGLVDNMHELMAVADAMVTKPGGLSITEALVSHLPLIFFNPIPGQETNNIMVLGQYGIGISHCSIAEIAGKLKELKSNTKLYHETLEKTKTLAKPNAVFEIINLIK